MAEQAVQRVVTKGQLYRELEQSTAFKELREQLRKRIEQDLADASLSCSGNEELDATIMGRAGFVYRTKLEVLETLTAIVKNNIT